MTELETIVLSHDIPEHGLQAGDIGVIVHLRNDDNFQVEFVSGEGDTVALLDLSLNDIRPMAPKEILHARKISA